MMAFYFEESRHAYRFDEGRLLTQSSFLNISVFIIIMNSIEHPLDFSCGTWIK